MNKEKRYAVVPSSVERAPTWIERLSLNLHRIFGSKLNSYRANRDLGDYYVGKRNMEKANKYYSKASDLASDLSKNPPEEEGFGNEEKILEIGPDKEIKKSYTGYEGMARYYAEQAQKARKKIKEGGLEKNISAISSIILILGGISFLSTRITGNTIANLSIKSTSFIGFCLLIGGLIVCFFWIKNRKKDMKK
jgi:hypothetical protein